MAGGSAMEAADSLAARALRPHLLLATCFVAPLIGCASVWGATSNVGQMNSVLGNGGIEAAPRSRSVQPPDVSCSPGGEGPVHRMVVVVSPYYRPAASFIVMREQLHCMIRAGVLAASARRVECGYRPTAARSSSSASPVYTASR